MMDRFWAILLENPGTKIVSMILAVVLWILVLGSRKWGVRHPPFILQERQRVVQDGRLQIQSKAPVRLQQPKDGMLLGQRALGDGDERIRGFKIELIECADEQIGEDVVLMPDRHQRVFEKSD